MKILLLGDFSAVHKNLKEGLENLGHTAVLASHGDGWKRIPTDIDLNSQLPSLVGTLHRKIKPFTSMSSLKGFDVVQLINPFAFHSKFFPTLYFYKKIARLNNKFFMLAAGDDAYFWRYARCSMKYGPFDDFLKYDIKASSCFMETDKALRFNNGVIEMVRGVIPIMYEYELGYADCEKRLNTIPIPINVDKVKFAPNEPGDKLTVFHGLNRYGFKGTHHVEKAFEYLSSKYPNDLELIISGHMPLNDYLELMQRTNIVIDQLNSYSLGVNGVYALAMGKVVMGGAELESLKSLGVASTPVINLKPNSQSIIDEVEKLLDRRREISSIGYESRLFAENVHGHTHIAQRYVDTWNLN